MVRSLTGRTPASSPRQRDLLETGIKVIDVMCPLVAGGTVALAGDLARRDHGGDGGIGAAAERRQRSVVDLRHDAAAVAGMALYAGTRLFARRGLEEGRVIARAQWAPCKPFFFRAEDGPWTRQRLAALAPMDTVIRLSHERAHRPRSIPRLTCWPRVVHACWKRRRWMVSMHDIAERARQGSGVAVGDIQRSFRVPQRSIAAATRAQRCRTISPSRSSGAELLHVTVQGATVSAAEAVAHLRGEIRDGRHMTTCRSRPSTSAAILRRSGQTAAVNLRLAQSQRICRMIERIDIWRNVRNWRRVQPIDATPSNLAR